MAGDPEKAYDSHLLTEHVGGVARLKFTSHTRDWMSRHGTDNDAVGDVTGSVTVGGNPVGNVGVYPTDDDPVSTDYLRFGLDGWEPGTYDVEVNGTEVGDLDVEAASKQKQSDTLPGGTTTPANEDDAPETDPADTPGMVNDGDGGAIPAPNYRDDVAPGSSSSGGSGGGVIGAVGVGIVLLLAGGAALLGGD